MKIVIEGPDATGKSTLAKTLCRETGIPIVNGGGPSKSNEEIEERAMRYLRMEGSFICDRHPCVSEPIYGKFRNPQTFLKTSIIDFFYKTKPFFIYCHGTAPGEHQLKDYDTEEHVGMLDINDMNIRDAYRKWAFVHVPARQWFNVGGRNPEKATQSLIKLCQEAAQ